MEHHPPEFAFLPRKFKIAISGATSDRAATLVHDIGLVALKDAAGNIGFRIAVGGGLGRTPIVGTVIRDFVPWQHLITYLEAILRVYNRLGRRDNKYKARIKILVKGIDARTVHRLGRSRIQKPPRMGRRCCRRPRLTPSPAALPGPPTKTCRRTTPPPLPSPPVTMTLRAGSAAIRASGAWLCRRLCRSSAWASRRATSRPTSWTRLPPSQTRQYEGELRVTHEQNLVFPDVEKSDCQYVARAQGAGHGGANIGLIGNIIACPGGDFCDLANAVSIPVAGYSRAL